MAYIYSAQKLQTVSLPINKARFAYYNDGLLISSNGYIYYYNFETNQLVQKAFNSELQSYSSFNSGIMSDTIYNGHFYILYSSDNYSNRYIYALFDYDIEAETISILYSQKGTSSYPDASYYCDIAGFIDNKICIQGYVANSGSITSGNGIISRAYDITNNTWSTSSPYGTYYGGSATTILNNNIYSDVYVPTGYYSSGKLDYYITYKSLSSGTSTQKTNISTSGLVNTSRTGMFTNTTNNSIYYLSSNKLYQLDTNNITLSEGSIVEGLPEDTTNNIRCCKKDDNTIYVISYTNSSGTSFSVYKMTGVDYHNNYSIKDKTGEDLLQRFLDKSPMVSIASEINKSNNKVQLTITTVLDEETKEYTTTPPTGKSLLGWSTLPNSTNPEIPLGQAITVNYETSTDLYEVYSITKKAILMHPVANGQQDLDVGLFPVTKINLIKDSSGESNWVPFDETTTYTTEIGSLSTIEQLNTLNTNKQEALVSGTNIKTINSTSVLGSGNIDTKELFYCTYGTTTYAEITQALSDGKIPACIYSGKCYVYSISEGTYHYLTNMLSNSAYYTRVDTSDVWTNSGITLERTSNKITSLSSGSTDVQYPSAKCVYDNLVLKQDALPTVVNDRFLHTNANTGAFEWTTVSSGNPVQDLTSNTAGTLDATAWTNLKANHSAIISSPTMTGLDSTYEFVNIKLIINSNNEFVKLNKNTTNKYSGLFFIEESTNLFEVAVYYNGTNIILRCAMVY